MEERVLSTQPSVNVPASTPPPPPPRVIDAKHPAYGTGRRKEAIARVYLRPGSGKFTVNDRTLEDYFRNAVWRLIATEPLRFTEIEGKVDITCTCRGGGAHGQAAAVRMGLSRAITQYDMELRPKLRKNGFLTRDSRMKERKKYGQKGARKRFQYSKR
jgi:small subunit ribosomal protein S9